MMGKQINNDGMNVIMGGNEAEREERNGEKITLKPAFRQPASIMPITQRNGDTERETITTVFEPTDCEPTLKSCVTDFLKRCVAR